MRVVYVLFVGFVAFGLGIILGYDMSKSNVKVRAKEINSKKSLNDTIYSQYEVEYIVFGESQE